VVDRRATPSASNLKKRRDRTSDFAPRRPRARILDAQLASLRDPSASRKQRDARRAMPDERKVSGPSAILPIVSSIMKLDARMDIPSGAPRNAPERGGIGRGRLGRDIGITLRPIYVTGRDATRRADESWKVERRRLRSGKDSEGRTSRIGRRFPSPPRCVAVPVCADAVSRPAKMAERSRRSCRARPQRSPPQFEIGQRDVVTCHRARSVFVTRIFRMRCAASHHSADRS